MSRCASFLSFAIGKSGEQPVSLSPHLLHTATPLADRHTQSQRAKKTEEKKEYKTNLGGSTDKKSEGIKLCEIGSKDQGDYTAGYFMLQNSGLTPNPPRSCHPHQQTQTTAIFRTQLPTLFSDAFSDAFPAPDRESKTYPVTIQVAAGEHSLNLNTGRRRAVKVKIAGR